MLFVSFSPYSFGKGRCRPLVWSSSPFLPSNIFVRRSLVKELPRLNGPLEPPAYLTPDQRTTLFPRLSPLRLPRSLFFVLFFFRALFKKQHIFCWTGIPFMFLLPHGSFFFLHGDTPRSWKVAPCPLFFCSPLVEGTGRASGSLAGRLPPSFQCPRCLRYPTSLLPANDPPSIFIQEFFFD